MVHIASPTLREGNETNESHRSLPLLMTIMQFKRGNLKLRDLQAIRLLKPGHVISYF